MMIVLSFYHHSWNYLCVYVCVREQLLGALVETLASVTYCFVKDKLQIKCPDSTSQFTLNL